MREGVAFDSSYEKDNRWYRKSKAHSMPKGEIPRTGECRLCDTSTSDLTL
jgi:hypothetical protein